MSFELLLCCALALYGLFNFVFVPRLTMAWNANKSASKVAKAGALSAVEFVRESALVAAIIYSCFALITLALGFGFFGNGNLLEMAVEFASEAHEWLEKIGHLWSHWFFLFPLFLLAWLQWMKQRKDLKVRFARFVDEENDRLNDERGREPGKWNQVAADGQLLDLNRQIAQAALTLQQLSQQDSKDKVERRRLKNLILTLQEKRTQQDYERRMNFERMNVREDGPYRQHAWQRALMSKGLFSDLKGFSEILNRVTLAMLAVALIGIAGQAGLAEQLTSRALHLDELRVKARIEDAKKSWENHPKPDKPQSPSNSDGATVQQLATDFGRALSRNRNWQTLQSSARVEEQFDRNVARRAILMETRLPNAQGDSRTPFSNGFSPGESQLLRDVVADRPAHPAGSGIGQIVQDRRGGEVREWFGVKWASVQTAIDRHAQTYREPVSTEDLQGELIDRLVAVAFDAGQPADLSDAMKHAFDGLSDAAKEAVREAVDTEFEQFMEDLYDGKPYDETLEKVRKADIPITRSKVAEIGVLMHDGELPDRHDLAERMAASPGDWKDPDAPDGGGTGSGPDSGAGPASGPDRDHPHVPSPNKPGSGDVTTASGHDPAPGPTPNKSAPLGGSAEAQDMLNTIATRATEGGASLAEEQVSALARYEDNFPRSVASQASTPLGRFLSAHTAPEDVPALTRMTAMNVERASSFTMLRGFSKVGGVLIGRDPEGSADMRDITWSETGRDVKIALVDAKGKQSWFGPYDMSMVHQALAYAADGRPVAVTMTLARPVPDLKVFLHPALLDTPLGCRVQELDRLVDTFADDTDLPDRGKIGDRYLQQVAVYNVALAKRTQVVSDKADNSSLKQFANDIEKGFGDSAAQGLQQPDLLSHDNIFRRKPEFFDPSLVKTLKSCQDGSLNKFEQCVLDTYQSSRAAREVKDDELRRWMIEPTSIEPWSGVRERAYSVDNDLSFLKPPTGSSPQDRVWPFDFIVQVAFTSAAINLPEKQQEVYVDRRPVEFDQIQGRIEELVSAGIDRKGFRPQFKDLQDFTILQRLFRAALDGNLGPQFPVMKLAQLTGATAGKAPYFHTRRWNSSRLEGFALTAQNASRVGDSAQPWIERARLKLPLCQAALAASLSGKSADLSSACDFKEFKSSAIAACPNSEQETPGCKWADVVFGSENLPAIAKIESAFGVISDDRLSTAGTDCPALEATSPSGIKR
jgi:hypothetical protein